MADDRIEIEITLDSGKVVQGLGRVEKTAKKSGKRIGRNLESGIKKAPLRAIKSVSKSLLSLRTGFVAIGTALVGALAVSKVVEAAKIQQDAINRLNTSLQGAGTFSQEASKDIQEFASTLQSASVVGDEMILDMVALAQTFVTTAKDAKELTAAALDFSVGAGISFEEAVRRLGRGVQGASGDIANFAPEIRKLTKEQLKAGAATKILAERFAGFAAGEVKTFSGATKQLSNTFGDLLEEFGFLIIKNEAVVKIVNILQGVFVKLIKIVSENQGVFRAFVTNGLLFIVDAGASVLSAVQFIVNSFNSLRKKVLQTKGAILSLFLTWENLTAKLTKGDMFGLFDSQIDKARANVTGLTEEMNGIVKEIDMLDANIESNNTLFQPIVDQAEALKVKLATVKAEISAAGSIGAGAVSMGGSVTAGGTPSTGETAPAPVERSNEDPDFLAAMESSLADAKVIEEQVNTIGSTVKSNFVGAISQSFQSLGAAMAGGKGAFENFGGVIFGILGDMAIQIGSTLIATGIGMEAIKASIVGLTGGPALFAGLALVTLGGLLKSLSGGAAAAPVGGGGITAPGGGGVPEIDEPVLNEEVEERKPSVNLTIQGNVMDRRETGLEIAEVINEVFGSNGIEVNV